VKLENPEGRAIEHSLRQQVQLARLLEVLARAANEAHTPEDAMRQCLVRITRHGGWDLARLGILADEVAGLPDRSYWHTARDRRYQRFIDASGAPRYFCAGGRFIRVVIEEQRPVWLSELDSITPPSRLCIAVQEGLHSAFAFPIVVHGKAIAFLEFLSEERRPADPDFMNEIVAVGAQIALVIDRSRAIAEKDRLNAELEQRVAARTAELAASNRELESFAYSVSHDLRSPLRAIDGFSKLIVEKSGQDLSPAVRGYLQRVRANAQQMGRLIDDLLSFSRLGRQALTSQEVNHVSLVAQCVQLLRQERADRGGQVSIGALPSCLGDASLLKQVWMNLLSNAFKFTAGRAQPHVEVGSREQKGEVVYFVRDNGAGFDMRYADKLFCVFQRLHKATEFPGTGVGLAIVQRIVLRHGGRVWAEAAPGKGATFYFTVKESEQ
jgi:signal transduction histidine kinase